MGIGRKLASQKGKECYELPSDTKGKAKKNRRRQKKMSPVQRLIEICKKVFAEFRPGIVPPSDDIQRIKSVLGKFYFRFLISVRAIVPKF